MRTIRAFLFVLVSFIGTAHGQTFEAPVLVPFGVQSAAVSNVAVSGLTGAGVTISDFTFTTAGQQVLLTAQTNPAENGIYQVNPTGDWYSTYPANASTTARPSVVLVSLGAQSRAVCFSSDWVGVGTASTWACTLAQGPYTKSAYVEASSDTTVAAGMSSDFLTLSYTKSLTPSALILRATFCASSSVAGSVNISQIYLDGVAQSTPAGQTIAMAGSIACGAIDIRLSGVAAGSHTIGLRLTAGAGDARVRPATVTGERASLLVEEVRQ